MNNQEHWENVYLAKGPNDVSWFRPHLETSLSLIDRITRGDKAAAIADIGGGASTLVDDLLDRGDVDITVVDISQHALDLAISRVGRRAGSVKWIRADATQFQRPHRSIDVCHDRAVFHFLTRGRDRADYVHALLHSVKPGGHVIISTFGPQGPSQCSGLDVVRYDSDSLHSEFGPHFQLIESSKELHETPFGTVQQFLYCHCSVA